MKLDVSTGIGFTVAGALRGPDDFSPAAFAWKMVVIAPLRFLVGVKSGCGATIQSPKDAQGEWSRMSPEKQEAVRRWAASPQAQHSRAHATTAYRVLDLHLSRVAAGKHLRWLYQENLL